jgi:hypothetical protein
MKSVRISLLNIVAAAVLFWLGASFIDKTITLSTAIWTVVLIVLILVIDQLFRIMLKSLSRVWLVEAIFLILSLLSIWIVRYIF